MSFVPNDKGFANHHCGRETFWEQQARTRWGRYIGAVERRAILNGHSAVSIPTVLLDVGADGGRWSQMLTAYGWRPICTDISDHSLALCKSRMPEAICIQVHPDEQRLPGQDDSVDLVLCIEVPRVMESVWFLAEVGRVLRPNGVLVGVFFNKCSLRGVVKHLYHRLRRGVGAGHYETCYRTWRSRLTGEGFCLIHEEGMCWFPFTRTSNSRLIEFLVPFERWLGLRRLPHLSPRIAFVAQRTWNSRSIRAYRPA